jgi:hypothetical protein
MAHRIVIEWWKKKINLEFSNTVDRETPTTNMMSYATRYRSHEVMNYLSKGDGTIPFAKKEGDEECATFI